MPSVTQLTPNFLGGVSRQNDDKKSEGQVSECINGYPDPTYGLLKRPGMKFIDKIKDSGSTPYNKAALDNATWFTLDRGAFGSYVGAIKGTNVYVWTTDGTPCTVTAPGGGAYSTGYLSGSDYHFRSIQDTTIVTNRGITTAMQPDGTYVANSVATLKLLSLTDGDEFTVTIQNQAVTVTAQSTTTFDDMLLYTAGSSEDVPTHHLIDGVRDLIITQQAVPNTDFDGKWYLEGYNNSIVIRRTNESNGVVTDYSTPGGTPLAFEIDARGGANNTAIEVFEDQVTNISKLPLESFGGHSVKILNSNTAEDDYHVVFVAYDTTLNRGRGFWKESLARDVSPGLDAATMPHEFKNTGATTFTFGPISWSAREAGDDTTNPKPSFIGQTITSTFFNNNRFGVLSDDDITFSVANDSYNFFSRSALTQIDSDPIDLNVSSIKPVRLIDVLPSPQGLTVFSERQQFQVFATNTTTLTPSTTIVRAISNYEMDPNIAPADVGTTAIFVSKVFEYSKVFSIQLQDVEQNPVVVDISKPVLEWIPSTVDDLIVSPQNSLVMLVDKDSSYLYLFRFYNNGQENLLQAWTKWQVTGTIQSAAILDDDIFIVSQHEDEYTFQKITLDEIPTGNVTVTGSNINGNPCLDFATVPVDPGSGSAVVYDTSTGVTKIYVPFTPIGTTQATVLITNPSTDAGYSIKAIPKVESGTNYHYFEAQKDQTAFANQMVVGYGYDFETTLPTFYYRRNETTTDYTAVLTISRVKVSSGRSGALTFKTRLGSSQEWTEVKEVTTINDYEATGNPVKPEFLFVVPIHQRNTNFELKVTSDFPYPVSLVSMMWEGTYSPRQYRRA